MNKLTPFLWFDSNAEEAFDFYKTIFPDAKKLNELRAPATAPYPSGAIIVLEVEILGQQITFLNGGPGHKLTPAVSLVVRCDDQAEIDRYWDALLAGGGSEMACGWLTDRFGLSWQIVPIGLFQWVSTPGGMAAMMKMKKFDIAALEAASRDQ